MSGSGFFLPPFPFTLDSDSAEVIFNIYWSVMLFGNFTVKAMNRFPFMKFFL